MKKIRYFLLFLGVVLFFCGCQSQVYSDGLYFPRGGSEDEYVVIYKDLIFFRLLRPESMHGDDVYWSWAGEYEISENGDFAFDMDKDELRDWEFYYNFRIHPGNRIQVENLSEPEKTHIFQRRPMQRRKITPMTDEIEPMY